MIMNKQTEKEIEQLIGVYDFKCICCGADIFDDGLFCPRCQKAVVENNGKTCRICGTPIHGIQDVCGKCGKAERSFDKAVSALRFEGALTSVFHRIKFGGQYALCRRLASVLIKPYQDNFDLPFDYVTYVPIEEEKRQTRGYNQSFLICQAFCDKMNFGAPADILVKIRPTPPQEKLSFQQRMENVKGAFAVTEEYKNELKSKRILLIDDVLTTGATTNECAATIKKKGATTVCVMTLASRAETIMTE